MGKNRTGHSGRKQQIRCEKLSNMQRDKNVENMRKKNLRDITTE